ncbi:extracellular solute-binding protein [Peribacillus loiseleuriae]|uniref:extracellular solute-binding protein n=1 Tax=Peribacillus loiseleuriae TaxID=1679170 RepID=UPI003D005075
MIEKRKLGSRTIIGGLSILLLGSMVACSNSSNDQSGTKQKSPQEETLVIYNGQHKDPSIALEKAFTEKTGIKTESREGNSEELAHQIVEEGDKSPADIIFSEETTPLRMLENNGLLEDINHDAISQVRKEFTDPKGQWIPVTARSRVVVYNKSMVKESDLPKSLYDFLTPKWKDKFAYVPTSGAFQQQLSAIIKLDGKDKAKQYLEGLKKYGKVYKGNKDALNAVENGEVAVGFINNYYWDQVAKEKGADHMKSGLYYFGNHDVGEMLSFSGMGILKSSKHKEAAQKFIEFATSKEGQQILTDLSSQYPSNPDVTNKNLKPFSELTPPEGTVDLGKYGDGKDAIKLLEEVGLL